jgi:hypothetical protein
VYQIIGITNLVRRDRGGWKLSTESVKTVLIDYIVLSIKAIIQLII